VIESNTVRRADGTGIRVEGDDIIVRGNTISGSLKVEATDADGIRFFGTDITIVDNEVRDIDAKGYAPGTEPHTDCFQTFDSDSPTTFRVYIFNNLCENVDSQCLIASGTERYNSGVPSGIAAIEFVGNTCDVGGAQAVYLESYPQVVVRGNTISGPNLYRGVYAAFGSTDVRVTDNVLTVPVPAAETDADSEYGLVDLRNCTS
jgi:hypothetical protein